MTCECPECGKNKESASILCIHVINDHGKWLSSYSESKGINITKVLAGRMLGKQDAFEPLTEALTRDFCEDCE